MERLAAAITESLIRKADYYIDLHGGDDYEELMQLEELLDKSFQLLYTNRLESQDESLLKNETHRGPY